MRRGKWLFIVILVKEKKCSNEFTCALSSVFFKKLSSHSVTLCGDCFWMIIPRNERAGVAIAKSFGLLMRPLPSS